MRIEKNISSAERIIRLVLAIILFVGFFYLSQPLNYISLVLAVILALTAGLSFCPIYQLIKKK
ncbi:MAG: DUF2892 domain-containing protein [Candidatus Micrarchaeota archaeon]|nr:DUF2892 domain-containing protein [Candidatus Micrarchaeota archaeon]